MLGPSSLPVLFYPFQQGGYGMWVTLGLGIAAFLTSLFLSVVLLVAKVRSTWTFLGAVACLMFALPVFASGLLFWRLALHRTEVEEYGRVDPEQAAEIRAEGKQEASWLPLMGIGAAFPAGVVSLGLLLLAGKRRQAEPG